MLMTWPAEVGRLDDGPGIVAVLDVLELVGHGVDFETAVEDLQSQVDAIVWH